jgi:ribonuclease R
LSDRVRVQVSRVDLDARKIDFRLVRDTPIKPGGTSRTAATARPVGEPEVPAAARGPHVRALASNEDGRRKKAAPGKSAAVVEARAARAQAARKRSGAPKGAPKARARKKG